MNTSLRVKLEYLDEIDVICISGIEKWSITAKITSELESVPFQVTPVSICP